MSENKIKLNRKLNSIIERSNIESNKQFQRLIEKTQVLMPNLGKNEVIKNRLTHSYEVMASSELILNDLALKHNCLPEDIDYEYSLRNSCLLHDIGHCPFGHDGARILNERFKSLGLKDGFSDNNNNLVVVDKNNILISPYTKASIIKYPNKLYPEQKHYLELLKKCTELDAIKIEKNLGIKLDPEKSKLTIACQIMDVADENSYICSDISDFLVLGNFLNVSDINEVMYGSDFVEHNSSLIGYLSNLIGIVKDSSKTIVRAYFNGIKNDFNRNYKLTSEGLVVINPELELYKDFLKKLEYEKFIKPIQTSEEYFINNKNFNEYIDLVLNNNYMPSIHYKSEISKAKESGNIELVLKNQRNMIAETTDWYVNRVVNDNCNIIKFDKNVNNG